MKRIAVLLNSVTIFFLVTFIFLSTSNLKGQLLGPGHQTVIKTEYQYSDYFKYTYPDPILYEYPDVLYVQPLPFIASFPEHRFLTRVTQYLGFTTSMVLRYQLSYLDKNNRQKTYNFRLNHDLDDQFSVMGAYQYMQFDTRSQGGKDFAGHMFELGGKFNFAGAVLIEPSFGYYTAGYFSADTRSGGAYMIILNLRQALTTTTAIQVKYNYMDVNFTTAQDEGEKFQANTLTTWLSQYLPTETAVHLSGRFYWNSMKTQSFSPGIEIIQYLTWDTILHLSYRYYKNRPKSELLLQRIKGDTFSTSAVSIILEYSLSANTKINVKYRYYTSDQDIVMNTYLLSLEQIL